MSETNSLDYSASNFAVSSRWNNTRFEEKSEITSKNQSRQHNDGEVVEIKEDEEPLNIDLMKKLYRQSYTLDLDELQMKNCSVDYGEEDAEVKKMKDAYLASARDSKETNSSPRKTNVLSPQSGGGFGNGNSTAFQIRSTFGGEPSLSRVESEGDLEVGKQDEIQQSRVSEVSLSLDDLPAHYTDIHQRVKEGALKLHLDMGAQPKFYAGKNGRPNRSVVMIPDSEPHRIIVPYGQFKPRYYPKDRFYNSRLDHYITKDEFNSTVAIADMLMKPSLGKATTFDFFMIFAITAGLALTIIACIILWIFIALWAAIAFSGVYIVVLSHMACISKKKNSKLVEEAHFVLAAFVKDENQRYYHRKGIRVRPGYLGKWIEFCIRH